MKGGINLHWFRNFKTNDALGFDIQLDPAVDTDVGKEVFAFLWNWTSGSDYPANAPFKECLNAQSTAAYNTTPVTAAALEKVHVEPIPEPTPTPDPDTNTEDDHSFKTTASVTALFGAVYALAF